MSIKRILTFAAIALLPIAAGAATFIVPAAGSAVGVNDSHWQTELMLHSASSAAMTVNLVFHDGKGAAETSALTLAPRATVALSDVVKTRFGRDNVIGAIEIDVDNALATKLAVTSRTFNLSENGEFGQDIPAVNVEQATGAGKSIVLAAPSNAAGTRFNAGLYAATAATVRWQLLRADGTSVKNVDQTYAAGTQTQYNVAVQSIFGEAPADSDAILAVVTSGAIIGYGSAVNNRTGDPTYVPSIETRPDILVHFEGVDTNLDNSVDIADADHDGVLDAPLPIYASSPWPSSFRLIVAGSNTSFTLLTPNPDVSITPDGYVIWKAQPSETPSGSIKVRVTADGISDVITIPVQFQ